MLVEKNFTSQPSFQVGDHVKIKSTGQVGQIIGFREGKWVVSVNGSSVLQEANTIEPKQVLFG